MRSADLTLRLGAAALLAGTLAGCVSTQTKNARLVLQNERTVASEGPVRVTATDPAVRVSAVQLLRAGTGAAVVVTLRNTGARPLSDLPIAVALTGAHGRTIALNGHANDPYYSDHVAAIGADATTTWVLTLGHVPPTGAGRPVARVGLPGSPPSTHAAALPHLTVTAAGSPRAADSPRAAVTAAGPPARRVAAAVAVAVAVANPSGVPQYGLPVYAVATRGGRIVAAGTGAIGELDGGSRARLHLRLIGRASPGSTLALSAPPTIFH